MDGLVEKARGDAIERESTLSNAYSSRRARRSLAAHARRLCSPCCGWCQGVDEPWASGRGRKALAINPLTPTTLYAGTNGGGAFQSTNGGASWVAVNSGLTNPSVLVSAPADAVIREAADVC